MNTYVPNALIQALSSNCIADHPSSEPVSFLSRGIRLLDRNEALIEGYLYVGNASELKKLLNKFEAGTFPVCIVTSGACNFFSEEYPKPSSFFLIESSLDLIPLYNQVQDCYHRTFNQKPNRTGEMIVNQAFQNLMTELLDEKLTDADEIAAYLNKNNLTIPNYFRLYAIRFNNTTNKGSIAWNYIISYLQQVIPSSFIATYNGRIVIIDKHVHRNKDFKSLEELLLPILEQYDGYFGIGNICGHLASIPAVYCQTATSINLGVKIDPKKRFFYYEDYAMLNIVELALQAAAISMHTRNPIHLMNNEAVKIIEYDYQNDDNLLEILDCFLRHNCNLKESSEALFIHRNTLRNKIEKIEEIMGVPLGDPTLEERLRFSCSAYRYISKVLKENPLKLRRNSEFSD